MKILNRIVTFILAVAVFPAAVTRIILRVVITPGGMLSTIMGETGIEEELSVVKIIDYIQSGTFEFIKELFDFANLPPVVSSLKGWLIASIVLLVIALLIALVIMGCSLFTQAHKTVMGLSVSAAISCFLSMSCFSKFATPFVDGKVDIGEILSKGVTEDGSLGGSIIAMMLQGSVDIEVLQLGNAVVTMALLFLGIAMWTFAYYITLPTEAKLAIKNPPVKEKKVKAKKEKASKAGK